LNQTFSFQHEDQAEVEIPNLDLTHSFIILGFIIGFSLVFGVGIIFSKLIHNKSIKQLDNGGKKIVYENILTKFLMINSFLKPLSLVKVIF